MAQNVRVRRGATAELAASAPVTALLVDVGTAVQEDARRRARVVSTRLADAIDTEIGLDNEGRYIDVGYNKSRPGWVLWFAEVGTSKQLATPHLRPALRPGII